MERLYANRSVSGGFDPPDQPDHPFWRDEWIPFLSDRDGWAGKFVDVRDGRVGRWFVGSPRSRASTNRWPGISTPWRRR